VAVLDPNHLFEQANKLITIQVGPPRQVDIRRAISAAYYATFHATITAAADQFIGVTSRDTRPRLDVSARQARQRVWHI